MFSTKEKQHIAAEIEKLLLSLNHPEMLAEHPKFTLHVDGKESWSWADIRPNWEFGSVPAAANPWNEQTHEQIKSAVPEVTKAVNARKN